MRVCQVGILEQLQCPEHYYRRSSYFLAFESRLPGAISHDLFRSLGFLPLFLFEDSVGLVL